VSFPTRIAGYWMTVFQGCAVHYIILMHLSVVIKPICTLSIFIFTFRIGRVPLKYVGKSEVELLSGEALPNLTEFFLVFGAYC
jgi:hypothetical protein